MFTYQTASIFKQADIQTLLSSSTVRKLFTQRRSKAFLGATERLVLQNAAGVQIEYFVHQPHNNNAHAAFLLHGWEGSADSSYIISAANRLFEQGFSIVRINFRDHGDTHHLNKTPFNSVRLAEISDTVLHISKQLKAEAVHLLGFSLGGNFALRLAASKELQTLPLKRVLAVCPAIDPVKTSSHLENGNPIYHGYFVKKWKRSLAKKYRYYPEIMRSHADLRHNTLNTMNNVFVPLHTDYDETERYLSAYAITQEVIDNINAETCVIYSLDDPIIAASDFATLTATKNVSFAKQAHGGHCAFLKNWQLASWIDDVALSFFLTSFSH
jgi:predicted alpha/beta-fold hydrolase